MAEAPAPEIDEEDFEQLKEIWQEIVTELQHKDQNAAAAADWTSTEEALRQAFKLLLN